MKRLVEWRVRKSKRRKGTLSLEKSSLDTLSLKKPLWKQTVLIGNPIFGESPLGCVIFEEASLKTNGSHRKPYLWRPPPWIQYLWRKPLWIRYLWRSLFENERFSLDTLSLKKPLWKRTVLLGYVIFEETSLKTNDSHWKPYLWRNLFENKRFSLETLSLEKASP